MGYNIGKIPGKTVDECKALCNAEPKCKAIEYGVAYGGKVNYKPGDCQLQSHNDPTKCDGSYYNLDLYIKPSC